MTPAFAYNDGDTVKKFSAQTASGQKFSVPGYAKTKKKKNLLLVFFRTGNCGVCVSQLVEFSQKLDEMEATNTAVVALSVDDAITQSRTAEKIENKFPILLDPDAEVTKRFDAFNPEEKLARPSLFLLDPKGKILYHYVGKDLHDRPAYPAVLDVLKHYSGSLPTRSTSSHMK